ncbi:hypothetical protein [Aliikangiella coralliicola]|uniref:Uncharacterized protein n=1 Tax=Aliikangiella coralliicola TaxID=2592383 RepID=A0A545UET3_9GAMM|nr:hypothetical protein [Aliikangiella coralliicola]TQV87968.1 hypothetical protein FLL46_09130 [Aliikangiella coralliicola]
MKKEIAVAVFAAIIASFITWLVTKTDEVVTTVQLEKIGNDIKNDENFLGVLLRKFNEDPRFKGKDGLDGQDGTDIKNLKLRSYEAVARNNNSVTSTTSIHFYCGINEIIFNFGGAGGNKECTVNKQSAGSWVIRARAEENQTLHCRVLCF